MIEVAEKYARRREWQEWQASQVLRVLHQPLRPCLLPIALTWLSCETPESHLISLVAGEAPERAFPLLLSSAWHCRAPHPSCDATVSP